MTDAERIADLEATIATLRSEHLADAFLRAMVVVDEAQAVAVAVAWALKNDGAGLAPAGEPRGNIEIVWRTSRESAEAFVDALKALEDG